MGITETDRKVRPDNVIGVVRQYWGFDRLRPLQAEAIQAGLDKRDSLVVMPTGGGKSLCYQVPPILAERTAVVVSPLIALMKDQVDGLRACGYPAAAIYSGLSPGEVQQIERDVLDNKLRLLFVAPERLLTSRFLNLIRRAGIATFAVDEAHCISQWGHDFRPEYRRLAELHDHLPDVSLHGFTATATERVRKDIVVQLRLNDPAVLVGSFDRPNLVYRVVARTDVYLQAVEVLNRHKGQASIVYCISRRDTESVADWLKSKGFRAAHYHAGMDADDRRKCQDDFSEEKLDIVVATVAFGMGIDRSDVRCVLHAAMPKSLEHYQQEAGRAGRDGLEAECVMLYSAADVIRWERLIDLSARRSEDPEAVSEAGRALLATMRSVATRQSCRHRAIVEYFGQEYGKDNCGACDVCLGEREGRDGTVDAQKILSCVARVNESFGVGHVVSVLRGAESERIQSFGHDQLSTFGLMRDTPEAALKGMVYQLLDQGLLDRTPGDRPVLKLNPSSWAVMRDKMQVSFLKTEQKVRRTKHDAESWQGVDRDLFEELRGLRRVLAEEQSVPPYVVFNDATLRDLARLRPASRETLVAVHGIGQRKADAYGERVMQCIDRYCTLHGKTRDVMLDSRQPELDKPRRSQRPNAIKAKAFELFARGDSTEGVAQALGRSPGTVSRYLCEFIALQRPDNIDPWVTPKNLRRIADAAGSQSTGFLKPIFDALNGEVGYEEIRVALAFLSLQSADGEPTSCE